MASVFSNRVDRLIDAATGSDSSSFFVNAGGLQVRGAEAELRGRLRAGLAGYTSYSYQRAEDTPSGAVSTNSPRHVVKAGVAAPLTSWLRASAETCYESSRLSVLRTTVQGHWLTNLTLATRRVDPAFTHVGISMQVLNLFDQEYSLPGRYENSEPTLQQDGRRMFLRVETGF
jgi:outer membrane receptor protein involved in Fe transport